MGTSSPAVVAEGTLNRLCAGDPIPTARNLIAFQWELGKLSIARCVNRIRNQGWRCLTRL